MDGAGKVYSPYYRQVHYRSFYEPYTSNGGKKAGVVAYQDIKSAFEYYLNFSIRADQSFWPVTTKVHFIVNY